MIRTVTAAIAALAGLALAGCSGGAPVPPGANELREAVVNKLATLPSFSKGGPDTVVQTMPMGMNQMHYTFFDAQSSGCEPTQGARFVCNLEMGTRRKVTNGYGVVDDYSAAVERLMCATGGCITFDGGRHVFEGSPSGLVYVGPA